MITGAIIIVGSNLYILNRTRKKQIAKRAALEAALAASETTPEKADLR